MALKIAINGFGRIGRVVTRLIATMDDVELVAINDLASIEMALYLLRYDSVHGRCRFNTALKDENTLQIAQQEVAYFQEKDPKKLDFGAVGADVVLECTGLFLTTDAVKHHLEKGVKKVIISAVAKDDTPTFVLGVNETLYSGENIISNGSCTTNCLAPLAKLLDQNFTIQKGLMTTIHSYTNGQNLLDVKHPNDMRRSRAAALNMIPTTTNAAKGIYKVLPNLKNKLHGQSVRVPVPDVSIMDLTVVLERNTTPKELELLFNKASRNELNGIILVDNDKRVSSDFLGCPFSSVVPSDLIQVMDHNLVKLMAWYDNESGYSNRLIEMAKFITK
jgi:glyceraldehyde 3-phosphate dehydrogenase